MHEVELSIIILCYGADEAIVTLVNETARLAEKLTGSHEIILVANYQDKSPGESQHLVQRIVQGNPKLRSLCMTKQGMMGWDMRVGLEAARGEYLCVIDGDGQYPVESIQQCYDAIRSGNYDLVKTYRVKRNDRWYRSVISRIYNVIFSLLFPGLHSRDINAKPKIFTRKAYQSMQLTSDDWFIDAEIMIAARRLNMVFKEFPVEFLELKGRKSFIRFPAMLEFMKNLLLFRIREFKRAYHGR